MVKALPCGAFWGRLFDFGSLSSIAAAAVLHACFYSRESFCSALPGAGSEHFSIWVEVGL